MFASKKQQNGSALVITILLVTVLASIGLMSSRLSLSNLRQTTKLEQSELAYQAAEAGLEMGLLLYRYDRNSELPNSNISEQLPDGFHMSEDEDWYYRVNLSKNKVEVIQDPEAPDTNESIVDIRMWHRNNDSIEEVVAEECTLSEDIESGECVQDVDTGRYYYPALEQDQVIEYDVEDLEKISKLNWEYLDYDPETSNRDQFQLIYIPIDKNGSIIDDCLNDNPGRDGCKFSYPITLSNLDINLPVNGIIVDSGKIKNADKIRIKALGGNLENYTIEVISNNSEDKSDSKTTYVEATGYYGGVKRKLKVELDRATNTLLTPYDFLLFTGN